MSARRHAAFIAVVAVLAVAFAALATWATSQLVSQRIGLASEPLTAGQRLLPKASVTRGAPARAGRGTRSTPNTAATAPSGTTRAPERTSAPEVAPRGEGASPTPPANRSSGEGESTDSSARRDD